jgi:hypothetical protein
MVGLYRVVLSRGRLSDMANLSWAKDAALAAAIRELEYEARDNQCHRATDPAKCPEIITSQNTMLAMTASLDNAGFAPFPTHHDKRA